MLFPACSRPVGFRSTLALMSLGVAALLACPRPVAVAETISINGGATWDGWTLRGISNRGYQEGSQSPVPGIFGRFTSGTTATAVYEVYATSFLFNSAVNMKTGTTTGSQTLSGSTGFGSSGTGAFKAFADGNEILGVGVKYVSGAPLSTDRTVRFDTFGDSYVAATTVAANNGRASFSQWAHRGDYTIQFDYLNFNVKSVNSQAGNPYNNGAGNGASDIRTLQGSNFSLSSNLPFRVFANTSSGTATSYQVFVDLDATYQLFGSPNGYGATIGASPNWYPVNAAGDNLTFSLNGWNNVDTAFGVAVVPEPSLHALAAVSLAVLGAGRLIVRRKRHSRRGAGSPSAAAADLPQAAADPAVDGPAGTA